MQTEKRELQQLKPSENNVRRHNNIQIREFEKSIKSFGVLRPIVIDENNTILAGHGLYSALLQSGEKEADCLVVKGLSDRDKKKLMLADNKIYSLGFDDYGQIEAILKELGAESDFDVPGYDSETLEELYGIKSVEEEVKKEGSLVDRALQSEHEIAGIDNITPSEEPKPSKHIEEERAKAEEKSRNFIVCPSCGEKIWL